jgi:hypothetical protein
MLTTWIVVTGVLASAPAAAGSTLSQDKRIAVLEFRGDYRNRVVEVDALKLLSDKARNGALQAVQGVGGYLIMTRETQQEILRQMGVCDLSEGECDLETGRSLHAHYFLTGEVLLIGGRLHLSIKFFETDSGRFLAEEAVKGTVDELIDQCSAATRQAVARGLGLSVDGGERAVDTPWQPGRRLVPPPKVRVTPGMGGPTSVQSLKAEELVEVALEVQDDPKSGPADIAHAWCALAAVEVSNPYRQPAREGCIRWQAYADDVERMARGMEQEYQGLARYLRLKRPTREQKRAAVDGFLATYGVLQGDPRVVAVQRARTTLELPEEDGTPPRRSSGDDKAGASASPNRLTYLARSLRWVGLTMVSAGVAFFMTGQLAITPASIIVGITTSPSVVFGVVVFVIGSTVLGAFALPPLVAGFMVGVVGVAWSLVD